MRISAIDASGKLRDSEAVRALLGILADEKKESLHEAAGTALARIGNPAALQGLLAILNNAKSSQRELAAAKLGLSGSPEAVGPLALIAGNRETKENLRRIALISLGKLGGSSALTALRAAAENEGVQIRENALAALGGMADPAAVTVLIEYADRTGYAARESAISELGDNRRTAALPVLRRLVIDKQVPSSVRQAACRAIQMMQDKQSADAVRSILNDSDKDLYEVGLRCLRSIVGSQADSAALTALKSTHASVRGLAAQQLQESQPPGVTVPLWEAYQAEKDYQAGFSITSALVALQFADQNAVRFLLGRLDPKADKLWYQDVALLRQITKQEFGPMRADVSEQERDAELRKWRQWGDNHR
jgi:HEAT repeat protein